MNATWFKGTGPVFLCVGGEGPALDASVVSPIVHCSDATELAPEVGALIVALEHRYYGKSIPPSSERGAQRLRHLTSHQAVADIAVFHKHISDEFKLPSTTKWIAFGGSLSRYDGGLLKITPAAPHPRRRVVVCAVARQGRHDRVQRPRRRRAGQ